MSRRPEAADADPRPRIDKWLWAARFYKTRALAHEALELGRVTVNDERAKPSRLVSTGDRLVIRLSPFEYHIEVTGLSGQRKGAKEAQLLYRETEASLAARTEKAALLRAEHASFPHGEGRPTKKARRDLMRLKSSC